MAMKILQNLCTPSYVYLVISTIFLILATFQNYGNVNTYCLGEYECNVPNTTLVFMIKIIYILFWTWILNLMCGAGATGIAWILVLLPFVLMFVMLGLLMIG
jgi:hypothetical protein